MLDRADDMVISGGFNIYLAELPPRAVVCVKAQASVAEKELVELGNDKSWPRRRSARSSARNFASRSGLLGSAGSQATDDVRGTLVRTSQEARAIHLLRRVL